MATAQRTAGSRRQARKPPLKARHRKQPGSTGKGSYYHIGVLPKSEFVYFRTHDVGQKGHIQRVAGRRSSGSWGTVTWLISKQDAHIRNGRLVADTAAAKKVLDGLGSRPDHVTGDRFRARPRPKVADGLRPTRAQKAASRPNLRKARAAKRRG